MPESTDEQLREELASPPPDDESALKKQLLNRIAIAGVIIVGLLGGLAVFDAFYVPAERPPPPQLVTKNPSLTTIMQPEPAAAESAGEEGKPTDTPSDGTEKSASATAPAIAGEPTPATVKEPAPAALKEPGKLPAKPEPAVVPEQTAAVTRPAHTPLKPLTPPATARPAMIKPSVPQATVRPDVEQEIAKAPTSPGPLSRPLSRAMGAARQYAIQMGVFSTLNNAEELRAKLELAGVPTQIEARVQVGPFKTREEAMAAQEKLRELGLEVGILTAIASRK